MPSCSSVSNKPPSSFSVSTSVPDAEVMRLRRHRHSARLHLLAGTPCIRSAFTFYLSTSISSSSSRLIIRSANCLCSSRRKLSLRTYRTIPTSKWTSPPLRRLLRHHRFYCPAFPAAAQIKVKSHSRWSRSSAVVKNKGERWTSPNSNNNSRAWMHPRALVSLYISNFDFGLRTRTPLNYYYFLGYN